MKQYLSILSAGLLAAFALNACTGDVDDPNVWALSAESVGVTAPSGSLPDINTTIYALKEQYSNYFVNNNTWTQIKKDVVFEGVVCANDEGGNLYQTIMLRDIDEAAGTDASIILAIKNSCLYPYFKMGQRVRVNLKGLYLGNYSYMPRIGQPYWTSVITTGSSTGNYRLGPILFELLRTNVELIGQPDPKAPELTPIDYTDEEGERWLCNTNHMNFRYCPQLCTVRGYIKEMYKANANIAESGLFLEGKEPLPKIFAPEVLEDQGYGVDRTLMFIHQTGKWMTIRTSTQNDIAFMRLPADTCTYTGVMSYYTGWQMNLRYTTDLKHQ